MAEDWSTVNVGQEKALGREIDLLLKHYLDHREALGKLASNAPTEALATEYVRLQDEIDQAIGKLNELERGAPSARRTFPGTALPPATAAAPLPLAGSRPLNAPLPSSPPAAARSPLTEVDSSGAGTTGRLLLIAAAGLLVLVVLAYLVWRRSVNHDEKPVVSEIAATTQTVDVPVASASQVETVPATMLSVTPPTFDFGKVRKGTRAVHKFALTNASSSAITLAVSRSTCKCLWFQFFPPVIPANGKGSIGVTIDGGRAKKGTVKETVTVSDKKDPQAAVSFDVTANVD
jgi:hypothetical protein